MFEKEIKSLIRAFEAFAKEAEKAFKGMSSIVFEELIEQPNPVTVKRFSYCMPSNQTLKHQVLNRKPRVVVARSCC